METYHRDSWLNSEVGIRKSEFPPTTHIDPEGWAEFRIPNSEFRISPLAGVQCCYQI
jgi:hypothetical protein